MEDTKKIDAGENQPANQKDQKKSISRPPRSVKVVIAKPEVIKSESLEKKTESEASIKSPGNATGKSSVRKIINSPKESPENPVNAAISTISVTDSSGTTAVKEETAGKKSTADEAVPVKTNELKVKDKKEKVESVKTPEEKAEVVKKSALKAEKKVEKLQTKIKKAKKKEVKKSKLKSLKDKLMKAFKKLKRYKKELKK